jgi:hypothetical protein
MECGEKARLIEEHHRAALAYSQAVRDLNGRIRDTPAEEYRILRAAADEARASSTEAHAALERHQSEHGC